MRVTRILVKLTAVSAGVAIAACSSSKATGPSPAKLAAMFDSAYRSDSTAGSPRTTFDLFTLIALDEGATPTSASVMTDGSALSMQMVGLVAYDTGSAAVADSSELVLGWTSDLSTEVATLLQGSVGPDPVPVHRVGVSGARLTAMRALASHLSPGGRVGSRSGPPSSSAAVWQGSAQASADSISVVASDAPASGTCTFEGVSTHTPVIASTSPCTNVTVTETFALHFPATAGIASTLTHMSLAPAKTVHGPRVLATSE